MRKRYEMRDKPCVIFRKPTIWKQSDMYIGFLGFLFFSYRLSDCQFQEIIVLVV